MTLESLQAARPGLTETLNRVCDHIIGFCEVVGFTITDADDVTFWVEGPADADPAMVQYLMNYATRFGIGMAYSDRI